VKIYVLLLTGVDGHF